LIGLSPLPTTHPKTFQRLLVRSSIGCYPNFNLVMGRSPSFASTASDSTPCSDSLSLRLRDSNHLTLPETVTRRLIMQKARRHRIILLRPLVSVWFQRLFHPGIPGSFHLSLTVLVHYRSLAVFSLGRWCCQIQTGFLRPRPTQDPCSRIPTDQYRALTVSG
jgi:hypothetical protein